MTEPMTGDSGLTDSLGTAPAAFAAAVFALSGTERVAVVVAAVALVALFVIVASMAVSITNLRTEARATKDKADGLELRTSALEARIKDPG